MERDDVKEMFYSQRMVNTKTENELERMGDFVNAWMTLFALSGVFQMDWQTVSDPKNVIMHMYTQELQQHTYQQE